MARACEVCGKTASMGNQVETRGKAKYLGGVGTKVTGISRRKFKPNLQTIRAALPDGSSRSMLVCTSCIRSGFVRKTVKHKPFKLGPTEKAKDKLAPTAPKAAAGKGAAQGAATKSAGGKSASAKGASAKGASAKSSSDKKSSKSKA
ncbi:MAG: 50S ribosomal protein L28 [Pirellulales bacterium]